MKASHGCSLREHTLWSLYIQTTLRVYVNLLKSTLALYTLGVHKLSHPWVWSAYWGISSGVYVNVCSAYFCLLSVLWYKTWLKLCVCGCVWVWLKMAIEQLKIEALPLKQGWKYFWREPGFHFQICSDFWADDGAQVLPVDSEAPAEYLIWIRSIRILGVVILSVFSTRLGILENPKELFTVVMRERIWGGVG